VEVSEVQGRNFWKALSSTRILLQWVHLRQPEEFSLYLLSILKLQVACRRFRSARELLQQLDAGNICSSSPERLFAR
jgi:hypothetical protein